MLAMFLVAVYGRHGALKPPLGPPSRPLHSLRMAWWRMTTRLYIYSGIPDRWEAWYRSP